MTSKDTGSSSVPKFRRLALAAATALLAGALVAGCGGGSDDEEVAAAATATKRARAEAAVDGSDAAVPPASAAEKQSRLADAVVDGKTSAPVDLKYNLLAKPEVGVPFEVELSVSPRLAADAIDVEVAEAAGLTIVGESTARFMPVEAGQAYTSRLLVRGDTPGLYYVSVIAKVSTPVQTETRAFAIPVVIGSPMAAQKAAPAKDAKGQAVQSLPAQEPK
jgi:hypothetical protein